MHIKYFKMPCFQLTHFLLLINYIFNLEKFLHLDHGHQSQKSWPFMKFSYITPAIDNEYKVYLLANTFETETSSYNFYISTD